MNSPLSSNSWIGRLIGDNQRYRLDKGLGGGGMGEVFLATDTRLGKEVALKLLKDKWLASGEMRKRFEREIAICAALQSEYIIEISDCGVTSEGFPFYVMEYLRGQTLRYLMAREKQLSPERTVKIMAQVCLGLQLPHQGIIMQRDGNNNRDRIKVIHRDLKPDNIFLLPTFGERVKILDFGIAKIHHNSSEKTNLTKTFIGTFRYSSPEQIQNDQNIDARADIYSLGIILYEMLSAVDPFGLSIDGNKVSETSWLNAHGYRSPVPLKQQPGCEHLSSELEAVVLKCLQKNPSSRFASVEELRQAMVAAIQPVAGTTQTQHKKVIIQPKSAQPQPGSNDETVSKPQPGSNDETVYKPQQRQLDNQSERANSQPQPLVTETELSQQPPIQNQPQAQIEGTIFQTPPSNPQQQRPDKTIFQPRIPTSPEPAKPDKTIFQPRTPTSPEPPKPDKTIFQPRPNSNPGQQQPIDGTIMQSPPQNVSNSRTPEKTIYQPRSDSPSSGQQKTESVINRLRTNNFHILQIIGITLALLSLGIIFYFIVSRNKPNDRKVPQTEKIQSSF
ncbi:protein kinase [Plectonema cf. radiosum LEGE 06105]|uniref:Protein kinase n=1 Tax=Plectonema cf. radiosum LEGE 06105 TaxID=945769 RepID=A0A8J7F4Q9_9CYAN|nr:serine/threonine-protein kinase [Plectonema radiosum]MBE9215070.1 protein kinase [Plectonema cf. radiosum LEGE 06105]